jgi:hypothetical protein
MTDKYELLTVGLFSERYGLTLRKIPETRDPTPDFDVYAGSEHVAVLEVKGLEETAPLVTVEELGDGDFIPRALQVDNGAGRVATKIHQATRQLEGARLPKVLVLVNDGDELDKFDLQEALQGFLSTDDGDRFATMRPSALDRMALDRLRIDLYVWIDEGAGEGPRLVTASTAGRALRERYFVEPAVESAG